MFGEGLIQEMLEITVFSPESTGQKKKGGGFMSVMMGQVST